MPPQTGKYSAGSNEEIPQRKDQHMLNNEEFSEESEAESITSLENEEDNSTDAYKMYFECSIETCPC